MLGGIVAQFADTVVATAAAASGLSSAVRVGRLVQYLISIFVAVPALGQLGVDTAILVTGLTTVVQTDAGDLIIPTSALLESVIQTAPAAPQPPTPPAM